ncbi:hypothetical protein CVT26_013216 [Gymnopilus dilepis]|uniref:Protein kinase domain-containing protein n=1 Tax=Gymnopilus dilepis TaxID=231916 RepID=A0A409WUZ2_9AGAR|nr:hypothetical protein CVT26_013216 [Gymnopilus dilepis]
MSSLLVAATVAPRFSLKDHVIGRYIVQRVRRECRIFQLLHVKDTLDGSSKVVRVINRCLTVDSRMLAEIAWLQGQKTEDEARHAVFLADYRDLRYFYLVFKKPARTLKDVLYDARLYLTRRHRREIGKQLVWALRSLHREGIVHTDISLENIEIVEDADHTEAVYLYDGFFGWRDVLATSRVRLSFYGQHGLNDVGNVGDDQYRSPESVFGLRVREASDVFSLGCVLFELARRKPLFPQCPSGSLYRREKAVLFDTILGPFPDHLIQDVRLIYSDVFRTSHSDGPEIDARMSRGIRDFADQALPLEVCASFCRCVMG